MNEICEFSPFFNNTKVLTSEVVPEIFPNLNVVANLVVPAGWNSCLPRLMIPPVKVHNKHHEGMISS